MSGVAFLKSVSMKPCIGSVVLFILTLPFVFFVARLIAFFLPDAIYYPLSFYWGFIEVTPLTFIIPILAWPVFKVIYVFIQRRRNALKFILTGTYVVLLAGATLVVGMGSLAAPGRFDVGHPYCHSDVVNVARCEGIDRGFMQDRISAVAMSGAPLADIDKVLTTYPDYELYETPCADLAGGFGTRCYAGSYLRSTGDTNYMNVYLGSDKALVLITENIVPLAEVTRTPELGRHERLESYVNLERFRNEF